MEKQNINAVRNAIIGTTQEADDMSPDMRVMALALVYVGDSIREAAQPDMSRSLERIAVELGGLGHIADSIRDMEVATIETK